MPIIDPPGQAPVVNRFGCDYGRADVDCLCDTIAVYRVARYRGQAVVYAENTWRYQVMALVLQKVAHRLKALQVVDQEWRHRYSNEAMQRLGLHRYSCSKVVDLQQQHRYRSFPEEVAPGVSEYDLAWKTGIGQFVPDIRVKWTGHGERVLADADEGIAYNLVISLHESAAAKWSLQIEDPLGQYHPRSSGDWAGWLNSKAYNGSDQIVKKLVVNLLWGGMPFEFVGVPKKFGHKRNFRRGTTLAMNWSGVDVSDKLFRPHQTKNTVRSERTGSVVTNRASMAGLCSDYGIASDFSRVPSRPVRLQHRQDGRAGDWLQAVLDCSGTEESWAEWQVIGETFTGYVPAVKSTPDWVYDITTAVVDEDQDEDESGITNSVCVRRAQEAGSKPADAEDEGVPMNDFGEYTQQFNPPLNGLRWRMKRPSPEGAVSDFIARAPNGNVIAVRFPKAGVWPVGLAGAPLNNVASITWTWGNVSGLAITSTPGAIEFLGSEGDQEDSDFGKTFDPGFVVNLEDTSSIGAYGRKHVELQANPLLIDQNHAEIYGRGYLKRSSRAAIKQTMQVPLNILMRPGDTILEVDPVIGTSRRRIVVTVTHSISNDPRQRFTRYTAREYEVL